MEINRIHDHGQELAPSGFVIGVIDTKDEVTEVAQMLEESEIDSQKIHVLQGEQGVELWCRSDHYFLADGEHKAIEDYNRELRDGHYVIAVKVQNEKEAELVSSICTSQGGRRFTYFGRLVVTRLT